MYCKEQIGLHFGTQPVHMSKQKMVHTKVFGAFKNEVSQNPILLIKLFQTGLLILLIL